MTRMNSAYSASEPSHQCTRSGWQSDSISLTQFFSFAFFVVALMAVSLVSRGMVRGPARAREKGRV